LGSRDCAWEGRSGIARLNLPDAHIEPVFERWLPNSLMASESEQIAAGFWRAVAEDFISHHLIKPVLGRSYLKLGQCFGLWGYLFELGGMLGAKHRAKLDAFVPAFMGMSGEAGAAERFLVPVANKLLDQYSLNSMKCWDFVGADLGDRVSYYKRDDWSSLVMERGTDKIPPEVASKNAWFYARYGAALGAPITKFEPRRAGFLGLT